jgi:hypothetical protein
MSYFRSYFSQNNTIQKSSYINTAKNPNTDIYYGNGFSKFIFKIDLNNLKQKITNKELILNSNTKHYLHLTNTIFGDESLTGEVNSRNKERTSSFDLILFKINEEWDEGVGFDYEKQNNLIDDSSFKTVASNWYNRKTLNKWNIDGIYNTSPTIVSTIHFDNGNENIHVDITSYINSILNNNEINYGLGLTFSNDLLNINTDIQQSVSFFTKYTQTFFEPYLESVFDDTIVDNRYNFVEKQIQKLYLFVDNETNAQNLDINPTVDILNSSNVQVSGLTNLSTVQVKKGVYEVSFGIDGQLCDGKRFFYDVWKNLSISNIQIPNVTQKFIPNSIASKYNIGGNENETKKFILQYNGIKQNEQIKKGEIRKLNVILKNINKEELISKNTYFRLYVKEGKIQVNIHDWTLMNNSNEIFYLLDTSYLIPKEYFIEIKTKINNEEIFYKENIKFEIINEK